MVLFMDKDYLRSFLISPDGTSLLGIQFRSFLAVEVVGELWHVGQRDVHPPRFAVVAEVALSYVML